MTDYLDYRVKTRLDRAVWMPRPSRIFATMLSGGWAISTRKAFFGSSKSASWLREPQRQQSVPDASASVVRSSWLLHAGERIEPRVLPSAHPGSIVSAPNRPAQY